MVTTFKNKRDNLLIKGLIVVAFTLLMLIPIKLLQTMIEEREENREVVEDEIGSKWGGQQKLTGPILVLPYHITPLDAKLDNPPYTTNINYAYFLPDDYRVTGEMKPEERSRSLFSVLVYQSDLQINGKFLKPKIEKLNLNSKHIRWEDAYFMLGISDMQGIKNKISIEINGKTYDAEPGKKENDNVGSRLIVKMPLDPENLPNEFDFKFNLALNGSPGLYFTPVGKETHVDLKSTWNDVSFLGDFLPTDRIFDDINGGFTAKWDVFDYNRNYAQMWKGAEFSLSDSSLGVDLIYPVDQYQMAMRSVKYAIMFIALTFVAFFLIEIMSSKPIHPVQYLLVSVALILFYSLLVALSEHIGFGLAYLVSAIAITAMITSYCYAILRNVKQSGIILIFLTSLYLYLYIVLQMEDQALLFGSIGLFIALAIVMYVTQKINWYKKDNNTPPSAPMPPYPPVSGIGDKTENQ